MRRKGKAAMQTHNRYMNIIAIVIAAACLSLAAACRGETSGCTTETPELTSRLNTSEEEHQQHQEIDILTWSVQSKYNSLFWRQPNVYNITPGFLRDDEGGWTDTWGLTVWVTEKVDQNALPPEDRIPDYLDEIPIQIMQADPSTKASQAICDYSKCTVPPRFRGESTDNSTNYILDHLDEVIHKYEPLLWRQPNVHAVVRGLISDEDGNMTERNGIIVEVIAKVEQDLLPPYDRIPDCLEGIPVQIIEAPMARYR